MDDDEAGPTRLERLAGDIFRATGRQAVWLVEGLIEQQRGSRRARGRPLRVRPSRSSIIRLTAAG